MKENTSFVRVNWTAKNKELKRHKEFIEWCGENHPDPDEIFSLGDHGEFICYQMWLTCKKYWEEKLQLPSDDDPLRSFESFVDKYQGDRLFPKTTFKEDYAGGSREYIQLEIVQEWLKSKLQ